MAIDGEVRRSAAEHAAIKQAVTESDDTALPFVSVILPVRNEANYIRQGLELLFAQDYPAELLEFLVADGMSDDGTREQVAQLERHDPRVRLIDNPERIPSTGLNRAMALARGAVFIRVDGHAWVACDFVRQSIAVLDDHPDAWCVGGPIVHVGRTRMGKAIAAAMSHGLGVGNAKHRFADYDGYGEGAAFPAIRRYAFERVGPFDEQLVRNQDDEWNFRVQLAGGRFYISPRIRYQYFVRERLGQLFQQYLQYGFWRIPVVRKHGRPVSIRQLVPLMFYLLVILLAVAGILMGRPAVAGALPLIYGTVLAAVGCTMIPCHGFVIAWLAVVAMATMHAGYALGTWYGIVSLLRRRPLPRDGRMANVTR